MATISQIKNRMHSGHRHVLTCINESSAVDAPETSIGQLRGYRKNMETLTRWGCVEDGKLTEKGEQLLAEVSLTLKKRI